MANTVATTNLEQWTQLLEQQEEELLVALLCDAPIIEVAEFLAQQPPQKFLALLRRLLKSFKGLFLRILKKNSS